MFACWANAFPQVGHLYGLTPAIWLGFNRYYTVRSSGSLGEGRSVGARSDAYNEEKQNYGNVRKRNTEEKGNIESTMLV